MDEARHRIRELRRKNTDGKWFIPEGSLVSRLSHEVIQNLIQNHCDIESYAVQENTRAIEIGARKVFAILVLIREAGKIATFREHRLLDARLPFSESDLLMVLNADLASEFAKQQWDFIAPIFSRQYLHHRLHKESRLPFIESRVIGGGGFGHVCEIVIPAGHHEFDGVDSTKVFLLLWLHSRITC